jgi:hypothetical protein
MIPSTARYKAEADVRSLIFQAQALDSQLVAWAKDLPSEWNYASWTWEITQQDESRSLLEDDLFFRNLVHYYRNLSQATLWNHYRAARVATNIIISRVLLLHSSSNAMTADPGVRIQQQCAQSKIKFLVDDICDSIPYFFGLVDDSRQQRIESSAPIIGNAIEKTTASTAFLLVWPLTIASAAVDNTEWQKLWIKSKIALLGRITGNGVLGVIAKVRIFDVTFIHWPCSLSRWIIPDKRYH